jgi:ribosomal protein L37AE/L43A
VKIQKIYLQHRRDFHAIYECEHCGATHRDIGYDDENFHDNVIPQMVCDQCGKKAPAEYRPLAPKHSENTVI